MTRISPMSTIIWNAREYRKSPTSTLAWLPNTVFAESLPRRRDEESTTSSCRSVAVWMNSMMAAARTCCSPAQPRARAASRTISGRRRLPPLETMYRDTCDTSATSLSRLVEIRRSVACMSSRARLLTASKVTVSIDVSAACIRDG